MHKNTKLTPLNRKEIFRLWGMGRSVTSLAKEFRVTRVIIYRILTRARIKDFSVHKSANHRFRKFFYGIKHINNAEKKALKELSRKIYRYEKDYPGQLIHFDTKSLRRVRHESSKAKSECLFIAIDDYSRYLFADILPRKNMESAAIFLTTFLSVSPFPVECVYSDNGSEFKGSESHDFMFACRLNGINQRFTRPHRPQTNGKAERVIRTILEECLQWDFKTREERRKMLHEYVVFYNTKRSHSALKQGKTNLTPCQRLKNYFNAKLYTTP